MRDYLNIGSSPCDEDCAQVGDPDYYARSRAECQAYITLIKAALGEPPAGCYLRIKSFPHDFGDYMEVVAVYDDTNEAAVDYAFKCEGEAPATWVYNGVDYRPKEAK